MSSTMTMSVTPIKLSMPVTTTMKPPSSSAATCCPSCGSSLEHTPLFADTQVALLDAHQQIADLQAQVRLLNQKTTAAIDRWADYEDELAKLREQLNRCSALTLASSTSATPATSSLPPPAASPPPTAALPTPSRSSFFSSGAATRISALLSTRKSTPNLKRQQQLSPPPPPLPHHTASASLGSRSSFGFPSGGVQGPFAPALPLSPTPSTDDLMEALSREQELRLAAEGKLNDTSREVEELSVKLFEQANEMVASERRARAKLEERVEMLERRDSDKRRRLERLESAMGRIERVRALLGQEKQVRRTQEWAAAALRTEPDD